MGSARIELGSHLYTVDGRGEAQGGWNYVSDPDMGSDAFVWAETYNASFQKV